MAEEVQYDPAQLVSGTVGSIVDKLGALSLAQLAQLEELERADSARPTLLKAIADERQKREDAAAAAAGTAQADPAAQVRTYTQAELDAAVAEHDAAVREELNGVIAQKEAEWSAERARLAAAQPEPVAAPARQAQPLTISAADLADDLRARDVRAIVFVDDADTPVPDTAVPMLSVSGDAFEATGGALIYLPDIEFPVQGIGFEIAGAFLLDDDADPIAKAQLAVPFRVGGGTPTKLAPRTLFFTKPAE